MIKADLVNRVVEASGVSRVQAAKAVESILYAMKEALGHKKRLASASEPAPACSPQCAGVG